MPASAGLRFRAAGPGDAHAIAGLHADSRQRHYRGAFSDAFLDNDAARYLLPLWTERLATPDPQARTILADRAGAVVGLAHTLLGQDATWGAFIDNLHVLHGLKRQGIGTRLLALTRRGRMARAVRPGPERRGQSLAGTGIPALGRTHQITESEYISTNRSRKKANIMAAQATTPRFTAAGVLRAWIIAGLGALILLMVFMLHTTAASASQAGPATRPCATSAAPCHKCSHCQKCTTCQKCMKCQDAGARCQCAA